MASLEPVNFKWVDVPNPAAAKGGTMRVKEPLPGSPWKVRFRKPNGRAGSKTFTGSRAKTDAKRFAESTETDKERGDFVDPRLRRQSFDEWAWSWWATTAKLAPQTRRGYWHLLNNHVLPYFGGRKLASIDFLDVELFIAHIQKERPGEKGEPPLPPLGWKRTRDAVSVVSLIMKLAMKSNVRKDNPAVDHDIPGRKKRVRRQDMFKIEQIEKFVGAMHEHYQPSGWTLVFTGFRPAELCGANVEDLDFMRRRIEVVETYQPVPAFGDEEHGGVHPYEMVTGPTKTEAGDRSIPLPAWLCDLIAQQLAERAEKYGCRPGPKDPLFVSRHGKRLNRDHYRWDIVRPALKAAGLPETFRTYDFRHNHASLLIDLGANVLQVAKRMGHADPSVTLKVYGHLFEDAQEHLTNKLEAHRVERMHELEAEAAQAEVVSLEERRERGSA